MQVKLFDQSNIEDLEQDINEFLNIKNKKSTFKLIDIRFNSYPFGEELMDYHSAMIIYQE